MKIHVEHQIHRYSKKDIERRTAGGIEAWSTTKTARSLIDDTRMVSILITDSKDIADAAVKGGKKDAIILVSEKAESVVDAITVSAPEDVAYWIVDALHRIASQHSKQK